MENLPTKSEEMTDEEYFKFLVEHGKKLQQQQFDSRKSISMTVSMTKELQQWMDNFRTILGWSRSGFIQTAIKTLLDRDDPLGTHKPKS